MPGSRLYCRLEEENILPDLLDDLLLEFPRNLRLKEKCYKRAFLPGPGGFQRLYVFFKILCAFCTS